MMILTAYNKENVSHKIYHATREPARRSSHTLPAVHTRTFDHVDTSDESDVESLHFIKPLQGAKCSALPTHLKRPAFRGVTPNAIYTVDPDLKGVPLQFIHQKIQSAGQRLFAAATRTVAPCPKGRLPRELEVIVNDISVDTPTHLFAVYSHPSALQKQRVALHPVHALILAANCANLPPIPAFKPRTPDFPGRKVSLPVVPLCIPDPPTFSILLDYLYTRRGEHLLRALLPLPLRDDAASLQHLARQLADSVATQGLMTYVYRTQGLWSNVAALGVSDEQLWRAMDVAWDVLRGAVAMRS